MTRKYLILAVLFVCLIVPFVAYGAAGISELITSATTGPQTTKYSYGCTNGSIQVSGASTSGISVTLEGSNGINCDVSPSTCSYATLATYTSKVINAQPTPPVQFVRANVSAFGVVATSTPRTTMTPFGTVTPATSTPVPTVTPGLSVSFYCPQ